MRGSLVRARRASATSAGRQWACMSIIMAIFLRGSSASLTPLPARRKAGQPARSMAPADPSQEFARSVALVGEEAHAAGTRATMKRDLGAGGRWGLLG